MTTTEAIFTKFAEALFAIGQEDGQLQGQAIALALRLAVQDAYAAGGALADDLAAIVASQTAIVAERDRLRAQLEEAEQELETRRTVGAAWVEEIDRLREQLAAMDADNARLIASLTASDKIQETLYQAIADRDAEIDRLTRENVIAVDTLNSTLEQHRNGNGANPTPAEWWMNLDAKTNDYRISLEHGRRKFREVPKPARLLLAQAFARSIGGGALPKQSEFDAHKPDWMPGGGGLVTTFGCNWSELLAISPFEVAP